MISKFNTDLALLIGIKKAVLLQKIYEMKFKFVIEDYFIIDKELLHNSATYIKKSTITTYLQKLTSDGYLDSYTPLGFNRTKLYRITEKSQIFLYS